MNAFTALVLCLGSIVFAQSPATHIAPNAKSQSTASDDKETGTLPYNMRVIARGFGNIGRWWSLLNRDDKAAFLDGYQEGMRRANQHERAVCEVIRQDATKNSNLTPGQFSEVAFVCSQQNETADYDKVTVKSLDDFYADQSNQFIPLELSMAHLRDQASGRKTEGQLLDALRGLQRNFDGSTSVPKP